MSRCRRCGAPTAATARFCAACGAATRQHVRQLSSRSESERRQSRRALAALAATCIGTYGALLAGSAWTSGLQDWTLLLPDLGLAIVAAMAAALAGAWRATLPLACRVRWLMLAAPVALLSMLVAVGYVELLGGRDAGDGGDGEANAAAVLATWVAVVVITPLVEEWLCRGVAWRAVATLANERSAWLATAVLFAFLHGMGGGFLLELPHRFVGGLLFGWLRWRSRSLLPGVAAHALHNALAVALAGAD